jgi:predicted nucleic acid-binding protein
VLYPVDPNVLLRFASRAHPLHPVVRAAVRKLRGQGPSLQAAAQNFIEFWNVATRPATSNGFGLSLVDAEWELRLIERVFPTARDSPAIYPEWRRLVVAYGVAGAKVHDARLVAAMRTNGIDRILTLNTADFTRYAPEGIAAVDPRTV